MKKYELTSAPLEPSTSDAEYFGSSVALLDGYTFVGATGAKNPYGGHVYAFESGQVAAAAEWGGTGSPKNFGAFLDVHQPTAILAVSAPWESGGAGAVYLYQIDGTWAPAPPLLAKLDGKPGDQLGWGLSIQCPTSNPKDLVVLAGAPGNGVVRMFRHYNSTIMSQPPDWYHDFELSSGKPTNRFGVGVSLSADAKHAVAGDWKETPTGGTYFYDLPPKGAMYTGLVVPATQPVGSLDHGTVNARTGRAIARVGNRFLVGSYLDDPQLPVTNEGSVALWSGSAGFGQSANDVLLRSDPSADDAASMLGFSVAGSRNGNWMVAVAGAPGAYRDNQGQNPAGAAFVYQGNQLEESQRLLFHGHPPGAQFGYSTAVLADELIAVGAPKWSSNRGSVHVFG